MLVRPWWPGPFKDDITTLTVAATGGDYAVGEGQVRQSGHHRRRHSRVGGVSKYGELWMKEPQITLNVRLSAPPSVQQ